MGEMHRVIEGSKEHKIFLQKGWIQGTNRRPVGLIDLEVMMWKRKNLLGEVEANDETQKEEPVMKLEGKAATSQNEYLEFHQKFNARAYDLTAKKNRDYAGAEDAFANFRLFGDQYALAGIVFRMGDKLRRLLRDATDSPLENESAEDSCLDLINYATIYAALRKQLREEVVE